MSGQVISLTNNQWVLGCAAGKEPYIAYHDSVDTSVTSSGLLLGLSCAGQFEIETPYFDNTQAYVESSPLKADTGSGGYQAASQVGQITLGTLSTAEDTLGFASNGGRQDITSVNSQAAPVNGHVYVLRFKTRWMPRVTTSS